MRNFSHHIINRCRIKDQVQDSSQTSTFPPPHLPSLFPLYGLIKTSGSSPTRQSLPFQDPIRACMENQSYPERYEKRIGKEVVYGRL